MHDLGVRVLSILLLSGVLMFVAFFLLSLLYPRRVAAASPAGNSHTVTMQPKDYGYLAPVARPLEWTLRAIESQVRHYAKKASWGWAVILTTFAVNLVLLPFRILAARNAKVMKALEPEIDAIKARYGRKSADPHSDQARELTELFKKHHTSPLSGCIPGLAPLVVLIAFYSVLTGLSQLHGAPWLWIADLSKPEALPVRILPLLMLATQFLVSRLTPPAAGADPRMARVMNWLPLIFTAILYNQPSALMLYWLTGNVLQAAQQWWLARRYA